ncbi:MAG: LLM class F420-dependent oxidoreductase [Acidimicrobiia bacterium]|nr:MAG: LLM class F420-dependent oxidoreductase [Acidimicrobiia bacterium]
MDTDVGTVGVFSGRLQTRPTGEALELVEQWGELGYGSVWVSESASAKNVLTFSAVLLGGTRAIVVASAIAVIWNRDPTAMMNAGRTLSDAHPGRFVLGMGVAHRDSVSRRGHDYARPLQAMRSYLEEMDIAAYDGHQPDRPAPRVLAALGPRMVALAGELTDGVHTFLTTPEHTATVRGMVGQEKLVAVEQGVVLTEDPDTGRAAARANLERFLNWPNYRRHLVRIGFTEADLAQGGTDRVLDALYVMGDEDAVARRVAEHVAAGADNVSLQVIPGGPVDEVETLRRLAPAVLNR